jgi:methyl-accepting chemotaxis protein
MFNVLNRLRIWQKLALVGVAFSVPLGVTTWFLLEEKQIKIDVATAELRGDEYLRPLARLLEHTARYRALSRRARAGERGLEKERAAMAAEVARDLDELDAVDARLGRHLATDASALAARQRQAAHPRQLRDLWQRLGAGGLDAGTQEALETQLIGDVRTLITHIGDQSKLILDPDLDTYYTMDALLLRMPDIVHRLHDLVDAADAMARRGEVSAEERARLAADMALLAAQVEGLRADVATAINEAPRFSGHRGLAAALGGPAAEIDVAVRAATEQIDVQLVRAVGPTVTAGDLHEAGARAVDAAARGWQVLLDQQDIMLRARRDGDLGRRTLAMWAVLAAVGVSIVLTALILRSITRPLRQAVAVADQLARGELPEKVEVGTATDETGALLRAINAMLQFLDLRRTISTLQESGRLLGDAMSELEQQTGQQGEAAVRQAAALQETQVTAQEIKQTSRLAAEKAAAVLKVAERAEAIGKLGESAIEKSIGGLTEIRAQAEEIAAKIDELGGRTAQIGVITQTVKDLADQSNMLALNAAIEAVRSGEHGKGFAVVAREIRSLADQSIQATNRVNEILDGVAAQIRATVSIAEVGRQRIEAGIAEIRASGDNLRELSEIVRDSSSSVRQIAAAVSQQDAGIGQIFGAVTDQSKLMDEAVRRVEGSKAAVGVVRMAGGQITQVAARFRV